MKRVLLTGASGFVGRQSIEPLLRRGYEIHAVWNSNAPDISNYGSITFHKADILDRREIQRLCQSVRATHLLHFAWYVEHGKFWNASENEDWLRAGIHLLDRFKENGGERVVMAGTCAEYQWGKTDILDEHSTPLLPETLYGRSKARLHARLAETVISHGWGRMFFLYGQFEARGRLIASIINSLLKNEIPECSHGNQIRDFLYVKDAAEAFSALLDSDVQGAVNIASGEGKKIKDVVMTVAEIMGKPENICFALETQGDDEPKSIVADTQRLNVELGWKPRYKLEEGIVETIESFRSR